jgi:hypothetical protein
VPTRRLAKLGAADQQIHLAADPAMALSLLGRRSRAGGAGGPEVRTELDLLAGAGEQRLGGPG